MSSSSRSLGLLLANNNGLDVWLVGQRDSNWASRAPPPARPVALDEEALLAVRRRHHQERLWPAARSTPSGQRLAGKNPDEARRVRVYIQMAVDHLPSLDKFYFERPSGSSRSWIMELSELRYSLPRAPTEGSHQPGAQRSRPLFPNDLLQVGPALLPPELARQVRLRL